METEEEQVEKLKSWLKENAMSIVMGVVIGVGGIGGFNYWQDLQESRAAEASARFEQVLAALQSGDREKLSEQASVLIDEFDSTDYAFMAQLALARDGVENGDFGQAELALQQVVGSAGESPLAYVARARLAAVQIQKGDYDAALSTLAVEFPAAFEARADELRGDAYAMLGRVDEAIEAYRGAQSAEPGPANGEFLRQKLEDLGATG